MNEEEYDIVDIQIRKEDMSHKYAKDDNMNNIEWNAVNNVLMLLWNNHPPTLIMNIFGKDPDNFEEENQFGYYDKFLQAISSRPDKVWSMLDKSNQERLVELAMKKYK